MPAKNTLKPYATNGYYHLYNRGVDKNEVFLDDQDFSVFLSYLIEYLSPQVPPTIEELRSRDRFYVRKNYNQVIELLSYCLMPNHFHFQLKQKEPRAIEGFMRSLLGRYVVYFNRHHQRIGPLFQSVYKGVLIERENYFLWLSRYIHRNPLEIVKKEGSLADYPYSSYAVYLKLRKSDWVKSEVILATAGKDYKRFVEDEENNKSKAPLDFDQYTLE